MALESADYKRSNIHIYINQNVNHNRIATLQVSGKQIQISPNTKLCLKGLFFYYHINPLTTLCMCV